jgi:hypothetical protein
MSKTIRKKKSTLVPIDSVEEKSFEDFLEQLPDKRFKTFPIKILSEKLIQIKKNCDSYKLLTGKTTIIHDWILEAIDEKLNKENDTDFR